MKKCFIDDIKSKGDVSKPGPGKYERNERFNTNSLSYVMAEKLKVTEAALERSGKLPGPGSYEHMDVTGAAMKVSNVGTEPKYKFGRAEDRFHVPTRKVASPAPDLYSPLVNLNDNKISTQWRDPQTKLGQDKSSIIDKNFKLNTTAKNPGPGKYHAFSEFSGMKA